MNTKGIKSNPEENSPAAFPADMDGNYSAAVRDSGIPVTGRSFPKPLMKANGKRDQGIPKDSLFTLRRNGVLHIISENYSYKTESYYTILHHELEGNLVRPSSSAVLDAYVVPICLERAKLAGIPVCPWGISQGYIPLPAMLYGLNYFATTSDYFVVRDNDSAKEVIKHITNIGKYPFCFQKLDDDATIHSCIAIFGKTVTPNAPVARMAEMVYEHYCIPLVTIVMVKSQDQYLLSSLAPTKYSQLSGKERTLLAAYRSYQEFL